MRRRELITLLGGAAAAWPLAARAQQRPVIGFLSNASSALFSERLRAFRQGLGETGYVEGVNVAIEYRWAEGQADRLRAMAADLVHRRVAVIMAGADPSALAAKATTGTIPIVFVGGNDPVILGLVASLNRPGANLTGVTVSNIALVPKRLQLLHELVPTATTIAVLIDPKNIPNAEIMAGEVESAARILGLHVQVYQAGTEREIDAVFETLVERRVAALMIAASAFFNVRSRQLGALTVRHAVPAIFQTRDFAVAGGLASYGASIVDQYRLAGAYTGRILKGEKPSDLPVQQSSKVELVINLKAAKALGITVPLPLLGRADEVIE